MLRASAFSKPLAKIIEEVADVMVGFFETRRNGDRGELESRLDFRSIDSLSALRFADLVEPPSIDCLGNLP